MSLLKFLTTGQSLVGMRDTGSRYRMRSENLLPKFISPKNPFAQPAPKSEAPVASPAGQPTPVKMETRSLFDSQSEKPAAPSVAPREIKVSVPQPSQPVKVEIKRVEAKRPEMPPRKPEPKPEPRRWFGWLQKLNPVTLFSTTRGQGMASRGRGVSGKPVQAELTLERVQVVRNDLRDADLEIVPGRLMGMPSGASPVLGNLARPDTGGWSRMTSRVLGLEHTHI